MSTWPRRAAAHIALSEAAPSELVPAAADLKAALKLRPAHPAICATLDDVSRRAAAASVDSPKCAKISKIQKMKIFLYLSLPREKLCAGREVLNEPAGVF